MFQKSPRIPSFLPAPARAAATMWGTPLTRPSGSAPAAKSFCTLAGWPRHISLFTRRASASSVSFVPSPVPFIFTARYVEYSVQRDEGSAFFYPKIRRKASRRATTRVEDDGRGRKKGFVTHSPRAGAPSELDHF